ncbi:MAG: thioredoxin-dependent thiol peroxidase [Patescibacteria group bacterium]
MLKVGQTAPLDIEVLDEQGLKTSLRKNLGQYLVLYFYPKDNTPGCTAEACSLRDYNSEIASQGAKVIGVSKDSIRSHQAFKNKHQLNFELWSDEEHQLIEGFGAWQPKKFMGREFMGIVRSSFLIDPSGKILQVWPKVTPQEHGLEILNVLRDLKAKKS